MPGKIRKLEDLIPLLRRLKRTGKTIVTTNGSFDILHAGHLSTLEEARRQGDVLAVLVNSDASVRAYKGPGRPIIPEGERAALVAALAAVDYVAVFNDVNPRDVLARIKPDVHVNGADYGKNCIEREAVEKNGGRIHIPRWSKGISTTDITARILEAHRRPAARAVFFDRDGTLNEDNPPHLYRREDFVFLPHAVGTLRTLSRAGYKIVVVTNQSGIGRGLYARDDVERLHRWMVKHLEKNGVRIDAIYYCPHHPDDGCACRKPRAGMLLQAARDHGINLSKSWIVGDHEKDIVAGREANLTTIKLHGRLPKNAPVRPHFYAEDLREAGRIILG